MKSFKYLIFIFSPIFVLSVGYFLYNLYTKSIEPHPDEVGKTALLTVRTAGKIGIFRYKGPMIRVSLYDDFMIIAAQDRIKVNYTNLSLKKTTYDVYMKSLMVMENSKEYPEEIYIYPPDSKEFYEILTNKGVKIIE